MTTTSNAYLFPENSGEYSAQGIYDAIAEARKQPRFSDLHLFAGETPRARLDGDIVSVGGKEISKTAVAEFVSGVNDNEEENTNLLKRYGSYTLVHSSNLAAGRLRITIWNTGGQPAVAIRLLGSEPPKLEELFLPSVYDRMAANDRGLSIVAGKVGSGKTTALAAVVDRMNADKAKNIVILEEYQEYVHKNKRSTVRSIIVGAGKDAPHYEAALDTALRNDADVIIIAEARTPDALQAAYMAADLGKRVLLTVHIDSVPRFADRIMGALPPEQQNGMRMLIAGQTQEVAYMRLVKRIQPTPQFGRIAACEILTRGEGFNSMVADPAAAVSLEAALSGYIRQRKGDGDQHLEDNLKKLADVDQIITRDEAMRNSLRPEEMKALFGETTAQGGNLGRW